MKFEEVLPALKNGKKIRRKEWFEKRFIYSEGLSVYKEDGGYYYMDCDQLLCDDWEIIEEPESDWDYIIKNKCLCWFWENNFEQRILGFLEGLPDDECDKGFFEIENGHFDNCRPVRRDEVTFYEDRKDEEE